MEVIRGRKLKSMTEVKTVITSPSSISEANDGIAQVIQTEDIVVVGVAPNDPDIKLFPKIPWENVVASGVAQINTINVVDSPVRLDFTCPENPADGDRIGFYAHNNYWTLNQDKVQQKMTIGNKQTTLGLQGKIRCTDIGDLLILVYLNGQWKKEVLEGHVDII